MLIKKAIPAVFLGLAVSSCIPRRPPPVMVEVDRRFAVSALREAGARNAMTRQITGFGHYRGSRGFLALEGSFTLSKDTQLLKLILHGPLGQVISEVDIPNAGAGSVLFSGLPEGTEDSLISARLTGNILMLEMHLGVDTALVSLENNRIKSLRLWGQTFVMSDYRPVGQGFEFPFRIDHSGPDGNATLLFDEVRLKEEETGPQ